MSPVDEQTRRSLEDWRRRLIDLSHRNRLIAYRETQGTTLQIAAPEIAELVPDSDREHASSWGFYFPPEGNGASRSSSSDAAATVDNLIVRSRRRRSSRQLEEIQFTEQDPRRIARVLDNLAKRSHAEFQDKALRVLYIAVGFLDWHDAHSEKDISSPLIMIPVELRRESAREPYRLAFVDDEDIVINPSLTEKLRRESSLALPSDWAWEDKLVSDELDEIRRAVKKTGWTVREHAVLSLFSFQKYVMYRDLLDNEDRVGAHSLVRSLAHGRLVEELREPDEGLPDALKLDDEQRPEETLSILDADASQRRCIESAKRRRSFVMQGPPGTGKSQTIANLIAEAIGHGKRVLFVSEKAAALDVVFNRLAGGGLDEYCLKLHSEHAGRREVVQALDRSLTSRLTPRHKMRRDDMERLADLRELLNETAAQLHLPHDILGQRSVREVHEELARLHAAPSAPGTPEPSDATGEGVQQEFFELTECFERLAERWAVTRRDFPWRGYVGERFTVDDRGRALAPLRAIVDATGWVGRETPNVAAALPGPKPRSLRDAQGVADLAAHLGEGEEVEPHWLELERGTLHAVADQAEQAYANLASAEHDISETYGGRALADLPADVVERFGTAKDDVRRHCGWAGGWEGDLAQLPDAVTALDALPPLIEEAERHGKIAAELLGQRTVPATPEGLIRMAELAELAATTQARPEPQWLRGAALDRARRSIEEIEPELSKYRSRSAALLERYRPEALELDASALAARFASASGVLSKLTSTYRSDVRSVKAVRMDGRLPKAVVEDLHEIAETSELGERLDARNTQLRKTLGSYATGRATDPDDVRRAMATAQRAIELSGRRADLRRLGAAVGTGAEPDPSHAEEAAELREISNELTTQLTALGHFVVLPDGAEHEHKIDKIRALVPRAAKPIRALADLVNELDLDSTPARRLGESERRAAAVERLRAARREVATARAGWEVTFGTRFADERTHWDGVRRSSRWIDRLQELLTVTPTPELRVRLALEEHSWPPAEELQRAIAAMRDGIAELTGLFDSDTAEELRRWCETQPLEEVATRCETLAGHVDDLYDWTDWCTRRRRAADARWAGFVDGLIEQAVRGDEVVPAFQRAYLNRRLEALYEREPELADDLRSAAFQRWVDLFRDLDRELVRTGPDRLIERRELERAAPVAGAGGEVDLLRREARKRRRYLPVRDLLSRIPGLLSELKPCLMMSPLSVSHYLSPQHVFDVVVFDEASQVPPQDAINCIYRGAQLVVAGDSRQLPPTSFFQITEDEPREAESTERVEEDMESVLDSCESLLPSEPLLWHYRSRSEPLIAFSNQRIYDNRLVTFPSTEDASPGRGVGFIHVPDGVYDRGHTATNRREAQVVAQRVAEHLSDGSERSVGVIAFNAAQATAISEELDLLRAEDPELEPHFRGTRLDAVFVKHLEAVQGDERDVIVLSVGYGRDAQGRFTSNFGPLNVEGGHRRLNVAITRARERLEVVASVQAHEFKLSDTASAGARMLREYIAYAEHDGRLPNGVRSPRANAAWASPFEEAIAAAVAEFGYEAVPKVGVGLFRIDIGVRARADAGRFILGIETDGDAYARTPTARDRERLRHEVLERLGWGPIHRIWSLDWVRNRNGEIDRLRQALETAQSRLDDADAAQPRRRPHERRAKPPTRVERVVHEITDASAATALPWTAPYRRAALRTSLAGRDFTAATSRRSQTDMVIRLVTTEGPVRAEYAIRRLGEAWGIKRLGTRGVAAAREAIGRAGQRGKIVARENFLWPRGYAFERVRVPTTGDPATRRDFDEIPAEEIDLAIRRLREAGGGASDQQLALQVARVFGFERVGMRMRGTIERRLEAAGHARVTVERGATPVAP